MEAIRSALFRHALGISAALAATACVSYRAPIGRDQLRGDLELRIDSAVGRPNEGAVLVDVRQAPPGARLLGAALAAKDTPPCSDGGRAIAFGRAPARPADAPLARGERLALAIPEAIPALVDGATRLDLRLETAAGAQRCFPLALVDPGETVAIEMRERFTFGIDVWIGPFIDQLGPIARVVMFPLTLGVWVDRVHLEVGGGVGVAVCPDDRCPLPSDAEPDETSVESFASSLFAGGDVTLFETWEIALGVGARYRLDYVTADTFAGEESFWIHGPALTPYLAAVAPVVRPFEVGGARAAMVAFEVPIGYAFAGSRGHSVSLGLNLRMRFTVL